MTLSILNNTGPALLAHPMHQFVQLEQWIFMFSSHWRSSATEQQQVSNWRSETQCRCEAACILGEGPWSGSTAGTEAELHLAAGHWQASKGLPSPPDSALPPRCDDGRLLVGLLNS